MKKFLKWFLIIVAMLSIVYFVGPKPKHPVYNLSLKDYSKITNLDSLVAKQEAEYKIKPQNESQIIWADSAKQKSEYAILYLPGFSASQVEGDPMHKNIAKKFGCNLILARLYGHGLQDTLHTFEDFTVDKYWESAKNAFAIAKQLGQKLIIMSTSTGGTLSLKLAAEYDGIAGQVMMSPNIAINDPNAWLLNNPWGKQIGKLVKGTDTLYSGRQDTIYKKYWNSRYNMNGAVELEEFLETSMTNTNFKKITEPICMLYYYKDEENQDPVVKVSAMLNMYDKVATPKNLKQKYAVPNVGNHVMGSYVQSKDLVTVEENITKFLKEVMQLKVK